MQILKLGSFALLLSLSASSFAQGWIEYADQAQFFSVNFPAEPAVRDYDYTSEYGAIFPARVYFVERDQSLHSLTVIDFTDGENKYEELTDKTDEANVATLWIYDQRGAIAHEASKLRQRGGQILYDGWHHIDRVEGLHLITTNADQSSTYAGLYLHANRLYILEATVPEGSPPQGLFQQSLASRIYRRFALLLSLSASSFAQGWIEYADQAQFFSVNFPAEPAVRDYDYTSEYGAIFPARVYFVERDQSLHSLTVIDFTDGDNKYEELTDKTDEKS